MMFKDIEEILFCFVEDGGNIMTKKDVLKM